LSTLSRAVFHPAHLLLRATATPVPSPLSLHDALPISPLFLGYLQGVDFLWTLRLWPEWLFVNSVLLAIYWLMDHFYHHPRETKRDIQRDVTQLRPLRIFGLSVNGILLLGIVVAVATLDPSKAF